MQRFDWPAVRKYWETHGALWTQAADPRDVDALQNVCLPHEPLWMNRHIARIQRISFERLFKRLPPPSAEARALDVGCGSGRWSGFLSRRGYRTTGIDLQAPLIERNRVRYPHVQFHCGPIQDCPDPGPFDLVTHVSVIQHLPFDQQERVIRKLRGLLAAGGHVLAMEDVESQGPHVFANSIQGWIVKYRQAGFECQAVRRYDYSICRRAWLALLRVAAARRSAPAAPASAPPVAPESFGHFDVPAQRAPGGVARRAARAVKRGILRGAVACDDLIEPTLMRVNPAISSYHCGFVFRAV
jgi:2-polyprenyl-3-methyl-5-hydroxy-6-metoxy-1,4-benzoquinol methylase